jgi:hypothetical protein
MHPWLAALEIERDARVEGRDADAERILQQLEDDDAWSFESWRPSFDTWRFVGGETMMGMKLASPLDAQNFQIGMQIGGATSSGEFAARVVAVDVMSGTIIVRVHR